VIDTAKIEAAVRMLLEGIGEDPEREGLKDTPARVARMFKEICGGLESDPTRHLETFFTEQHDEMVLVKNIPIYSICEHHLVPFFGQAHIAYIPHEGKLLGLSKMARIADEYAKRPQLQERLTSQIANSIMEKAKPRGVLVVIEAEHMCMTMRGVRKAGSKTITSAVRGLFQHNSYCCLVGKKGHISYYHRPLSSPGYCSGMVKHLLHGYRQGILIA
jgi:GTP cyclohydrolase I